MTHFSIETDKSAGATLHLKGSWTLAALAGIRREVAALKLKDVAQVMVDGGGLADFDTSGAWCLDMLATHWRDHGITVDVQHFKKGHRQIFDRVSSLPQGKTERRRGDRPRKLYYQRLFRTAVAALGRQIDRIAGDCERATAYFGAFLTQLARRLFFMQSLRWQSVAFHVNEIGLRAVPIIALMAFSIAFVMGYQGAFQLQKFNATVYTVDLIVISMLREMGVLVTAIMVAGRSGSAFAAELGTMKLNEEVDALKTMGVAPFEVLVLPRLIAILIALPLLTVTADAMGLLGGYVFSSTYLGYSFAQFHSLMVGAADMTQFYVGLSKAPVFALLIGIVGCMQGLQAKISAEDVGRKTITAVVQSIFLVIVTDAVFSVIFTKMGI